MSDSSKTPSFSRLRQIDSEFKIPARTKTQVRCPTIQDIIFHRRNVPRTRYYVTSGHEHLGKPRNVNEEQSPFIFPPKSHMFAYHQWWKSFSRGSLRRRKSGFRAAQKHLDSRSKDILRRLRVDVEAEVDEGPVHKDLDKVTAITDIDPNYFTEVKGRLGVGERFSRQRYVEEAREVLRTRLLIGVQRDDCIRIDQQFDEEERRLNDIKRRYRNYVNGFEEFLSRDHEDSMAILEKAEDEVKKTYEITTIRNQLSKELGQVRLEVYSSEEMWRIVKMCQKFLYQVSPTSWRREHDWIHRSSSGTSLASEKLEDLLGRYKHTDSSAPLESLIEMFEADIASARPPQLYFKDPKELVAIFRSMELQNLNALIHLESLAGPMADMATSITEAESLIKREIGEIQEALEDLEDSINSAEERAVSLENYANYLLHGVFRDLVCSEPVLYLRVFIEDTYESCIAPNDSNLDTYSMMRAIERKYEELNMQLDNLPHEIVRVCEKEGFRQEMKAMKDAEDAARKFELMHRLLASLERIMEPPKPRKRQPVTRAPPPTKSKAKAISPRPPQIYEEQMVFLNFFTNYCKLDEPEAFESQFPDDFDLSFKSKRPVAQEGDDGFDGVDEPHAENPEEGNNGFCIDLPNTSIE